MTLEKGSSEILVNTLGFGCCPTLRDFVTLNICSKTIIKLLAVYQWLQKLWRKIRKNSCSNLQTRHFLKTNPARICVSVVHPWDLSEEVLVISPSEYLSWTFILGILTSLNKILSSKQSSLYRLWNVHGWARSSALDSPTLHRWPLRCWCPKIRRLRCY